MKKSTWRYRALALLIWPVLRLLYPFRFVHRERLPASGAVVLCGMHSQMLDPVMLLYLPGLHRQVRFMAKKELFTVPVLRGILNAFGAFPVNREQADIQSLRTSLGILQNGGILGIFPEGTRNKTAGEGKRGAVWLAAKTGAALVPVYVPREKRLFRCSRLIVGEPMFVEKHSGGSEVYEKQTEELMRRMEALGAESR